MTKILILFSLIKLLNLSLILNLSSLISINFNHSFEKFNSPASTSVQKLDL